MIDRLPDGLIGSSIPKGPRSLRKRKLEIHPMKVLGSLAGDQLHDIGSSNSSNTSHSDDPPSFSGDVKCQSTIKTEDNLLASGTGRSDSSVATSHFFKRMRYGSPSRDDERKSENFPGSYSDAHGGHYFSPSSPIMKFLTFKQWGIPKLTNNNLLHTGFNPEEESVCDSSESDITKTESSAVKLSIESIKVPDLFIYVPVTATVASLRETMVEAVTELVRDGVRIVVLHRGEEMRDGNRTLLQTGITSKVNLDFALERPLRLTSDDDSKALVLYPKSKRCDGMQRRARRPFSVGEVEMLVKAVEEVGTGRWRDVKMLWFGDADHRTYVDLKDKWKTLVHTARITPQQRRGAHLPEKLLDRVLKAQTLWSDRSDFKNLPLTWKSESVD